ncbi:uncharacterized protein BO80DRAFT_343901 [Aspergillus ibericus CBS 121593]|uniref:Putative zinc-finger domain-containing protein n=1 Tax=Aspergillus ibericus CBS 121593 TaxID=1448316 RepID=A0A395HEU6_9EURO|nr:hypothetical protein BO80DRAFT_343901 [Aspergillus ibericus CBS 121593]RAL06039.1 hypothetical protein BO80DRAFT_343901 [Aspergillus ibericus CBS 121593]
MPSLFPPSLGFSQHPSPVPQHPQDGSGRPFEYNTDSYNGNTHLPGLGGPGAAGPLPPPPFAFMGPFASTQFPPPPFHPLQMPPLRYPSIPVPSAPIYEPTRHAAGDYQMDHSIPPVPQLAAAANSECDPDREEGELTDREAPSALQPRQHGPNSGQRPGHGPGTQVHRALNGDSGLVGGSQAIKSDGSASYGSNDSHLSAMAISEGSGQGSSDMEKGGASPESHLSSRSSGSPYNPAPPTIDAIGPKVAASSKPQREGVPENETNSTASCESSSLPGGGKSPAQLRVQAQGALLSLAPHNIRYGEFVGEGINPVILRQLYEEVGIKITTPQPELSVASPPSDSPLESERSTTSQSGEPESGTRPLDDLSNADGTSAQQATPAETVTAVPSSLPSETAKPMERKEVIARMLAAKAAKSSGASAQVQGGVIKVSERPDLPDADKMAIITPEAGQTKEKEVRVKEKNKAQTELARQRIELLKKQGLVRNGQKPQSESVPPEKGQPPNNSGQDLPSTSTPIPIQHPLPERPPDPESNAPARIPGLFMTEEPIADDSPSVSATPSLADTTPQARINQRKRPRASDFDEPVPIPKKSFNNGVNHGIPDNQRLIIDISDDEFYGDDENDIMEVDTPAGKELADTEGLLGTYTSSVDVMPLRPATASSQGFSTSATPQSLRNNDQEHQEHLRRKNLEIKAMHKRIAELEERKKAKLAASRTQSPRASDVPAPSPSTNNGLADDVSNMSRPSTEAEDGNSFTGPGDGILSTNVDIAHMERMRDKLLRKQEIEAGIPALEAEIHKSETKLAEIKHEEGQLLAEITKGKEGRQQLMDELININIELNGLTFDDVEAAMRRSQTEEQPSENEGKCYFPSLSAKLEYQVLENGEMTPEIPQAELPVQEEKEAQESARETVQGDQIAPPVPTSGSSIVSNDKLMHDVSDSSGDVSSSDSTGSAMDESSDSSSDESVDEDEHQAQTPVSETNGLEVTDEPAEHDQHNSVEAVADLHHTLPERPLPMDVEPQAEPVADEQAIENEGQASRESSVSDGYEPPEPEVTASPADSTYSPPFSPASLGPVESMDLSTTDGMKQADEPLTGNIQALDIQQPSAATQVGVLDNPREPEEPEHKFSPYVSPLKYFKAYRYHPNFTENVSDGYRSLTYSHNIDPMKCLCPFEASGGVCNDRSCEFQHFRDMTLSDDKILVQMGSLREGKTPEEKDEYIAGLKQIINDMRRDKVKDFNTVATEIAAYRRRFLQDPSRVLPL